MTRRIIALALTFAAATACGGATAPAKFSSQLAWARARWSERGLASYDITVTRSCECTSDMTGPVLVAVRKGAVASRRYVSTQDTVPSGLAAEFRSVEEMFSFIASVKAKNPADLHVSYDAATGYPARVSIDYNATTADDEIVYSMTALTAR